MAEGARSQGGWGRGGGQKHESFLPRRSPPARAAQEPTPLWSMPQTKEKNAKKNKTTARRFMAPQTAPQPTTHNAARRHTQAIADTQRRENTQALGSHVFVGVRVLRARGCPDAPPQA